ncbi:MAG: radical SAM protein [Chloroflexi bacterium]|nr:radical SAM protein [Chloroflexota bacterium]
MAITVASSRPVKNVLLVAPKSTGGNFEYVAIPRQGPLYISGALKQWDGEFRYEREVWYEDRNGKLDPEKDLDHVDLLMVTALINEAPRAYQITRSARQAHPNLKIIGGGPHMSPLYEEALRFGMIDVVVQREGEDIIGHLSDILLNYSGQELYAHLSKIPGIAYLQDGKAVVTPRHGAIHPHFVEVPDFASMKDLTSRNPLAAGVMETVRGCTEKCNYCQVIQQFLGYRVVPRDVELKRLAQLHKLAEDGLIYTARDGRFSVFISDDLHTPPLRAVKFRDERLARLKGWKGHTDDMWMICQCRAEIGQDPELAQTMLEAGIRMVYVGVESSSAENLKAVNKRQDPGQMHKDLTTLNEMGFIVTAMTIIGLPYDTDESIMKMAEWVKTVSRYQTANLLTPLPATINWNLTPLDEDGSILPEGKMRPYHLYTGRQLVHYDKRWGLQESRELYARYTGSLHTVDKMYERIFRIFKSKAYYEVMERREEETRQVITTSRASARPTDAPVNQLEDGLRRVFSQTRDAVLASISELADSYALWTAGANAPGASRAVELRLAARGKVADLQETLSLKMDDLGATLSSRLAELRSSFSLTTGDLRDAASAKLDEIGEVVAARVGDIRSAIATRASDLRGTLFLRPDASGPAGPVRGGTEMAEALSARLIELADAVSSTLADFKRQWAETQWSAGPAQA